MDVANTGLISVSGVVTDPDSGDTIDRVEIAVEDMSNGALTISNQRARVTGDTWKILVNINTGGKYKIKATAFDSNGAQNSQEVDDVIVVDPHKPTIVINEPRKTLTRPTIVNTKTINLDFEIINSQLGNITYEIKWGEDGQKENGSVSITSPSTRLTKNHTYNMKGSKKITITARDPRNIRVSEFVDIIIQ